MQQGKETQTEMVSAMAKEKDWVTEKARAWGLATDSELATAWDQLR